MRRSRLDRLIPRDHLASCAWLDNAVLVYGPRKAGTTLFQNLLDGGEELLAYPAELKLKNFARTLRETQRAAAYFKRSRVPLVRSDRFSIETYRSMWEAATSDRSRWPLGDLVRFDAWCVAQSCARPPARVSMWCAKEVGGGRRDIFAFWRRFFRPARALFIVRDPLVTTRAVLNNRRRSGRRLSARMIAHETLDPMRTIRRQCRHLDDPDVHFTVYEELVEDPAREMDKVADFLGIGRSAVLASPTLFGEPVVVRTASKPTTEVFRQAPCWRDGLTSREQKIVAAVARTARSLPGLAVDYEALRDRIAARQPQSAP